MSITKEVKKDLISKFAINDKDTGSAEVQIAVQTERINNLIEHFKNHKHDNHSKRGLVALVNNRKKYSNILRIWTMHQFLLYSIYTYFTTLCI